MSVGVYVPAQPVSDKRFDHMISGTTNYGKIMISEVP